ncbi:MAG: ribonuclease HII [Pseudobdellovibrionaceae bacterium]
MKTIANYFEPIDWRSFSTNDPNYTIIGVDEVGRGCLAGPVYAAAVSFNSDILSDLVTDSKLLSEKRRDELAVEIKKHHQVGLGFATVEEIDDINILQASLLAMKRAVQNLGRTSGHLLIDGNKTIPAMSAKFKQTTIVKGDLRVSLISAASIVAKVARDQLMKDLGHQFPVYGFEDHKGYSTAAHKKNIADHGPCIWHRKTFSGVKEYLSL